MRILPLGIVFFSGGQELVTEILNVAPVSFGRHAGIITQTGRKEISYFNVFRSLERSSCVLR